MSVTFADIEAAHHAIAGTVIRTPAISAWGLAGLGPSQIVLKLENLQLSGSFKARGALNRLMALTEGERSRGVIAMSAGNHAQGVAWHARSLGIPATIVMPKITPFTKVIRTEALGARVVLEGEGLAEAEDHAKGIAAAEGLTLIHPYDDPRIIAGQGSVAVELLADHPDLEVIIVPVGGGGLIAGIAIAAKAINPKVEIIGVQASSYATMSRRPPPVPAPASLQTLAEGIAVKRPGALTRPIIDSLVDDLVTVDELAIERAVEILLERQKVVAEGAGAASMGAVLAEPDRFAGRKVGLVVSGGNVDNRLLASVLMRGLVRDGRMARMRIDITDAPGTLAKVSNLIGANGGNILEVYHHRLFQDVPVKHAELDIVVEATDNRHVRAMVEALCAEGFNTRLLGSNAAASE